MVLKYHQSDYKGLPAEGDIMASLRQHDLAPGDYMMPHCDDGAAAMKDPAFIDRWNKGPVALMTVWKPGPPAMGAQLGQWFIFCVVASGFAAYLAGRALEPGADYMEVFRFAGTAAFGAYALGGIPESIWYKKQWGARMKHVLDGFIYGLLTGGIFGWLWPAAMTGA